MNTHTNDHHLLPTITISTNENVSSISDTDTPSGSNNHHNSSNNDVTTLHEFVDLNTYAQTATFSNAIHVDTSILLLQSHALPISSSSSSSPSSSNDNDTPQNHNSVTVTPPSSDKRILHHASYDTISYPSTVTANTTTTTTTTNNHPMSHRSCLVPPFKIYFDEGMYMYTQPLLSLPVVEQQHPIDEMTVSMLTLQYNIGHNYIETNQFMHAIRQFNVVLHGLVLHPKQYGYVLHTIHHNIGYCWYRLGKYIESKNAYELSYTIACDHTLPSIHMAASQNAISVIQLVNDSCPSTSKSITTTLTDDDGTTATVPSSSSDRARTIHVLVQCYAIYCHHFGINSKESATILNNIGRACFIYEQYTMAIQYFQQCYDLRIQLFGPIYDEMKHEYYNNVPIDIAVSICNMGQTYHRLGEYDLALEKYHMFLQVLCCHSELFSMYHVDIIVIKLYIAGIYYKQNKLQLSKEQYEQLIQINYTTSLLDFPLLAKIYSQLGSIHYRQHDMNGAIQYYTECYQIQQQQMLLQANATQYYHQICSSMTTTLMKIAEIQRQLKCYLSAMYIYNKIIDLQTNIVGPSSKEIARALSYMGLTHYEQGNFAVAVQYYTRALQVYHIIYSYEDNVDVASVLNSIGLALFHQKQYDRAGSCFSISLQMKKKILGPNHIDVAVLWYNIASTHYDQRNYDNAITCYRECVRVERLIMSNNASSTDMNNETKCCDRRCTVGSTVYALQKIGTIYHENGEFDDALIYFNEALEIELRSSVRNERHIAKLYNYIGNIHLQRADISSMMEHYIKSSRIFQSMSDGCDQIDSNIGRSMTFHDNGTNTLIIAGYGFYYLSRMHPPGAAVA